MPSPPSSSLLSLLSPALVLDLLKFVFETNGSLADRVLVELNGIDESMTSPVFSPVVAPLSPPPLSLQNNGNIAANIPEDVLGVILEWGGSRRTCFAASLVCRGWKEKSLDLLFSASSPSVFPPFTLSSPFQSLQMTLGLKARRLRLIQQVDEAADSTPGSSNSPVLPLRSKHFTLRFPPLPRSNLNSYSFALLDSVCLSLPWHFPHLVSIKIKTGGRGPLDLLQHLRLFFTHCPLLEHVASDHVVVAVTPAAVATAVAEEEVAEVGGEEALLNGFSKLKSLDIQCPGHALEQALIESFFRKCAMPCLESLTLNMYYSNEFPTLLARLAAQGRVAAEDTPPDHLPSPPHPSPLDIKLVALISQFDGLAFEFPRYCGNFLRSITLSGIDGDCHEDILCIIQDCLHLSSLSLDRVNITPLVLDAIGSFYESSSTPNRKLTHLSFKKIPLSNLDSTALERLLFSSSSSIPGSLITRTCIAQHLISLSVRGCEMLLDIPCFAHLLKLVSKADTNLSLLRNLDMSLCKRQHFMDINFLDWMRDEMVNECLNEFALGCMAGKKTLNVNARGFADWIQDRLSKIHNRF